MATNKYIHQIRSAGSENNILDRMFSNPNIQSLSQTFQKKTGLSSERINNISELSEVNMELTEQVLKRLDTTLNIYNISGILLGAASVLVVINEAKNFIRGSKA